MASNLDLIEHDQRAVLLFKINDVLKVPIEMLSGENERQLEMRLRDALSDPAKLGHGWRFLYVAHTVAAPLLA